MANKKNSEIRDYTDKQLRETLADEKLNYSKLHLSHAVSPLENSMRLVHSRKFIARMKTEQKRRQMEAAKTINA